MKINHYSYGVSVVIPVYNSYKSAIFAIDSVLSQTFPCKEIIIVDDGSIDDSALFIKQKYKHLSSRVRVFSIKNRGASAARNFGISKASYYWIAFLDSDDVWLPSKLEKQLIELKKDPSIMLIGSLTNMMNFTIYSTVAKKKQCIVSLRTLLFKNYFQTSTVVISRLVLDRLGGFPEARRYAEEGDLFMRVAAKYKCVLLNEVMVDYSGGKRGFGISGLSANLLEMEKGELDNILRVWMRRDAGMLLIGVALIYSIIKFFRRAVIRSRRN
jgi:glycosyltransferase involved in cell wall biosynthesis